MSPHSHSLAAILSPSSTLPPPLPSEDRSAGTPGSTTPKRTHSEAFTSVDIKPYLHPTSPAAQHRASISSTAPSPGTRIDDGSHGGMNGGREDKRQASKMVRSSVACSRCRKSKVKCVNDGPGTVCKSCMNTNRECTYPASGSTATPKREPGIKQEEGEGKKRSRKVDDSGRRNSVRMDDPFDAPVLNTKVWSDVFELFKSHFSTEMPFLHIPTLRSRINDARNPAASPADSQNARIVLLGILTLTARFHTVLVSHHSQPGKPVDPLDASEYYATALKSAFGPSGANLTKPTLEGVQALLMLGLYEWGQTRGLSAWVYVGIAIRLAQSMGLAFEDDPENRSFKPKHKPGTKTPPTPNDEITVKEVRRRTLWSCFVMDRFLSAGKYRPNMITVTNLRIQLPCSVYNFNFVRQVHTGFLNSDWLEDSQLPTPPQDDGVLSRYMRLVEIFGRFSEWSYAGGRRTEKLPPWYKETQFFQLSRELEAFHEALPSNLKFTDSNLSAHIEMHDATAYVSMHTLYSLCMIMLHREFVPFIPIRCKEPEGPLDEPTFPKSKYKPGSFWKDSAAKMCSAARNIVDIASTCQDRSALPESPQIGFAVYQAAFVCVYVSHFPQMDYQHHLHGEHEVYANGELRFKGFDASSVKILKEMIPRLKMAKSYVKTLKKMHDYYQNIKHEFETRFPVNKRMGWVGGGLEQYKMLEKELKEFGSLEDTDKSIPSDGSDGADGRSRASTNDLGAPNLPEQGPGQVQVQVQGQGQGGEPMQGVENAHTPRPLAAGAWAAVNASSPPMEVDDRPRYHSHHQYPHQFQSPSQNSNPPSLISPSNGESTPAIHSPYQPQYPQAQHMAIYPSMAQHTQSMQAPIPQGLSEEANEQWMFEKEQISMAGGHFDHFIQDDSLPAGYVTYDNTFPQNYFGVLNGQPSQFPTTMSTY